MQSSLNIRYSYERDYPLHTGAGWLRGKRHVDAIDATLWRIHNALYDFSNFIDRHPGGAKWLQLTQGTDITEAFESHHLNPNVSKHLSKYLVRNCQIIKRNSPFTFDPDGFYGTLRKRVWFKLQELGDEPKFESKCYADGLLIAYLMTMIWALMWYNFLMGTISGILLSLLAIASHNFFHQKMNFRRFYFDMTLMRSREWQVTHVLSHHLYTNTVQDIEISVVEPFLNYMPIKKNFIIRYLSWFYSPIIYCITFLAYFFRGILDDLIHNQYDVGPECILPFIVPISLHLIGGFNPAFLLVMFLYIQIIGSIHFVAVGLTAAHHHPGIFHDGDEPKNYPTIDWGIHQMDATWDRNIGNPFMVLIHFGEHVLHHLFPTLDHAYLRHLYPILVQTCADFNIEWHRISQSEMVIGQFKQLARIDRRKLNKK